MGWSISEVCEGEQFGPLVHLRTANILCVLDGVEHRLCKGRGQPTANGVPHYEGG